MTEFEIAPNLLSKPVCLSVFREVMKAKVPDNIVDYFSDLASADPALLGRHFTIGHFLVALFLVARKLFSPAHQDASMNALLGMEKTNDAGE